MRVFRHAFAAFGVLTLCVPAFKAAKWVIGLGGDVDFILSRSKDPDWVGRMLTLLIEAPGWLVLLLLVTGVFLIVWDNRRSRAKITPKFPAVLQI